MRPVFAATAALFGLPAAAVAQPPIEAYGELPDVSQMALSPAGDHLAYVVRTGESEGLIVVETGKGIVGGVKVEKGTTRRVFFPTNDHVILQASTLSSAFGVKRDFEFTSAAAYNIKTQKLARLLRDMSSYQSGLGRVIGVRRGANSAFMPAFTDISSQQAYYNVVDVNLDTGHGRVEFEAGGDTLDWFITPNGVAIAREDFSRYDKDYAVRTQRSGSWEKVYFADIDEPPFYLVGMLEDESALVVWDEKKNAGHSSLFELKFSGELSEPLFAKPDRDINDLVDGLNRQIYGVSYTGLLPTYEFFDADLTEAVSSFQSKLPGSAAELVGWSDGFKKMLFYVAGSRRAPAYYLHDRELGSVVRISGAYDEINDEDVGEVFTISYAARDGLKISAIVTLPPSVEKPDHLPLIVIPHGGPEAYDAVGFDWMAQYFANRGYLVLQPNFRGSGGFGIAFREAGYGEWGGKMQDDITDGVARLVKSGWADPNRICIIGASYGGYAALAGGAFTPDLYKCIAAIAPVADLEMVLREVKREAGSKSLSFEYAEDYMGDLKDDLEKIRRISPVNNGASFKAPVLLIHGDGDTVVPFIQSRKMESALKNAGKSVAFVKLKNEDHWLSQSETRLQTLRELDKFVAANIGPR